MRLFTAEALILDVFDLHDRDRIVTFLTREQGKKKGVAQGARTKAQPLRGAAPAAFQGAGDLVREGGRI